MSSSPTKIYGHETLPVTRADAPSRRNNRMNQEDPEDERSHRGSICAPCNHSYLQNETHCISKCISIWHFLLWEDCQKQIWRSAYTLVSFLFRPSVICQFKWIRISMFYTNFFWSEINRTARIHMVSNTTYLQACDCHMVFSVQHKNTAAWVYWKLLSVWNKKKR